MTRAMTKMLLAGAGLIACVGTVQAGERPVARGELPPPGQCRIWYPDRAARQQLPPMSCRAAYRHAQRYGGRVIRGERYHRGRHDRDAGYGDEERGRSYGERYERYERDHGGEYRRRWEKPISP
jgi:hypothetical protein